MHRSKCGLESVGAGFACCCFDSVFSLLVLTAGPEEVCVWRMICVLRNVISIPEYSISINAHLTDNTAVCLCTTCILDWCSHLRGPAVAHIVMCWLHYHGHMRVWYDVRVCVHELCTITSSTHSAGVLFMSCDTRWFAHRWWKRNKMRMMTSMISHLETQLWVLVVCFCVISRRCLIVIVVGDTWNCLGANWNKN